MHFRESWKVMRRRRFNVFFPLLFSFVFSQRHLVLQELQVHMVPFFACLDLVPLLQQALADMAVPRLLLRHCLDSMRLHGCNVPVHCLFEGDFFLELRSRQPRSTVRLLQRLCANAGHRSLGTAVEALHIRQNHRRLLICSRSSSRHHAQTPSLWGRLLLEARGGSGSAFARRRGQSLLSVELLGEKETKIPIFAHEPPHIAKCQVELPTICSTLTNALHQCPEHGKDLVLGEVGELQSSLAKVEVLEGTKLMRWGLSRFRQVSADERVRELDMRPICRVA
mmetsp:Transcript_55506/g.76934  ORF Transcript_55506/g.76934 Transcript_55506/m.76934 type:complete len:281 (-) Transcript_55506:178-1020(-)